MNTSQIKQEINHMRKFVEALNREMFIKEAWLDDFNSYANFQFGIIIDSNSHNRYSTNTVKALIRRVLMCDMLKDTIHVNLEVYNAPKRSFESFALRTGEHYSPNHWMFDGNVTL